MTASETVNESVIRCLHAGVLIGEVSNPRAGDEFLALQNPAEQQADDDEDDGDFHQGETALRSS